MMCAGIFRRACVVLHPDHKQDLDLVLGEATALKESLVDKLISLKDSHQGSGIGEPGSKLHQICRLCPADCSLDICCVSITC